MSFNQININSGLPSNWVKSILKDSRGFIWFVSNDGLIRYDGTKLKHYPYSFSYENKNSPVEMQYLTSVEEDVDGNIWVGTEGVGLNKYDFENDRFIHYTKSNSPFNYSDNYINDFYCNDNLLYIATNKGVDVIDLTTNDSEHISPSNEQNNSKGNRVECIHVDSKHILWMGTEYGLISIDLQSDYRYQYVNDPKNNYSISGNSITAIFEDELGNIWVGTQKSGLNMFDKNANRFIRFSTSNNGMGRLSDNSILSLFGDNRGFLFIGTENGGLNTMNIHTHEVNHHLVNYTDENGLKDKSIHSIYFDNEGIIWLGTFNSGVNYAIPQPFHYKHYKYSENGLINPNILSVAQDEKGKIWIGTDGDGINIFNKKKEKYNYLFNNITDKYSLKKSAIKKIFFDSQGNAWIAVYRRGIFKVNVKKERVEPVFIIKGDSVDVELDVMNIFESPQDELLFATTNELYIIDQSNNSYQPYLKKDAPARDFLAYCSPALSKDGFLWIGHGSGLMKIDPSTRQAENFDKVWSQQGEFENRSISNIFIDSNDNIWCAPFKKGIFLFDRQKETFIEYPENDRLINKEIVNFFEDHRGNLWVNSPNGVSILENAVNILFKGELINYEVNDNFISRNSICVTGTDEFIIGGNNGFMFFDVSSPISINSVIPPVCITEFYLNNKLILPDNEISILNSSIETTGEIKLNYKQNSFSFEFAALSYREPSLNNYSVYLENFDVEGQWLDLGNKNTINYTNIPSGLYKFHVKASNNNGLWNNKAKTIAIIVDPPFYKTKWAFVLYFAFIALLILFQFYFVNINFQLKYQKVEYEKIKELDILKTNFLTNISHEFKTPLTLIIDPIENILNTKGLDNKVKEKLKIISGNARRLQRMTNQLLDYQRVIAGKDALNLQKGNLIEFIGNIISLFEPRLKKKNQKINYQTDNALSNVLFDADKIERIIYNLLSNAIKFTDKEGSIDLNVNVIDANKIQIVVSDNGIGISENDLQNIFNRFYRIEKKSDQKIEGTGIGLALTKELVRIYGGDIKVESEEGIGSSFIVELPVFSDRKFILHSEKQNKLDAEKIIDAQEDEGLTPLKTNETCVLIVEDNEELRTYIKDELSDKYVIKEAENGKEGKLLARKYVPDLIVSDVMMPELDGVEMCRQLKAKNETSHIPLLLLTAKTEQSQQVEGVKAGADDYITKPFSMLILKEKIKNILKTRQSLIEKYSQELITEPSSAPIPEIEKQFLSRIVEIIEENLTDPEFNLTLVSDKIGMSKSSFFRKLKAVTGKSPLEFLQAYKMEKAISLIKAGKRNVSEIAYDTGFSYPSYFTLSFKKYFGKSPTDYIKKIHSKA
ncbi:MAG: response regulator [Prolixibacteraceae bacterium]|nr:response regulator [Prolixibacteraceae bacterium]